MRKLLYGLTAMMAVLAAGATSAEAQAGLKLGFIDSRKIAAEAPGFQEARETMQREMGRLEGQLKPQADSLDALMADYQKKQATLTADARRQKEQEIVQKRQVFEQRAEQLQQQAQRREQELIEPVMKRIKDVIEELRKDGGYAIIFDAANGVVAADSALDLTTHVITRLKATAAAAPKKP